MTIALIRNGVVENVIVGTLEFAQTLGYDACVETDEAGIGWTWDGVTLSPPNAPDPEPEVLTRHITRLAFLQRITMNEHVAIELASIHDPASDTATQVRAATLRKMLQLVNAATWIDLDRPDTRGMVQQIEAMGMLAPGRALEILDGEILPIERPTAESGMAAPL